MTITIAPVYCKDCGSRNSWQRQPDQDIKSESGKVLWERWRCKTCGATTIKPVPDEGKKEDYCQLIDSLASAELRATHESIGLSNRCEGMI